MVLENTLDNLRKKRFFNLVGKKVLVNLDTYFANGKIVKFDKGIGYANQTGENKESFLISFDKNKIDDKGLYIWLNYNENGNYIGNGYCRYFTENQINFNEFK